jgi:hypothetical protein
LPAHTTAQLAAIDLEGVPLYAATAEDVVISKLEWAKLGESERQIQDVAGMLRARWNELDRAYVAKWVRELGPGAQWQHTCGIAGVQDPAER